MVLEHVDLYGSTGEGPVDDLDYCLPVGKAAVRRSGSALTVISYLAMTNYVLAAVDELGDVDAEVIDLRWLDRASIDWDTIGESIRKTNNVLIAEQGPRGTSYGGWLADEIQRRYFDWLDQPVKRVTGGEASPSISKVLEQAADRPGPTRSPPRCPRIGGRRCHAGPAADAPRSRLEARPAAVLAEWLVVAESASSRPPRYGRHAWRRTKAVLRG